MSCDLKKAQGKVVNFCLLGDEPIFTGKLQIHIVSAASISIASLPCHTLRIHIRVVMNNAPEGKLSEQKIK